MKVLVQGIHACGHVGNAVNVEQAKKHVAKTYAKLFVGPCPACLGEGVDDEDSSARLR